MRNPFSRAVGQRDGLPVMPGGFPLVGHIPALYKDTAEVIRQTNRELGPLFWMSAGFDQWFLVCCGVEALEILKSKAFTSTHLQDIAPLVAGQSMLAHDGASHRHMRSAMNAPFVPKGLAASTVGPMIAGALSELVDGWMEKKRAAVLPDIQRTALEIIFRMLGVGTDNMEAWRKQYRSLLLANLNIKLRFPGSPAVRSERAKKWIDAQLIEIVAEARRSAKTDTVLSSLAHAADEDGNPLTETELLDNLRLMILGGHETISATMAWITLHLAKAPELWDGLVEEVRAAGGVPLTPQEMQAFPFAEALFRETVRVHPPFGLMTRKAVTPFELHGRTIPEGAIVAVNLWGVSHDESLFPDPDEFRPARWLGRKTAPSSVEISQFGAGPHFCLGYHLAWLEAVQFAVVLGQKAGEKNLRPVARGEGSLRPIYLPTEHPSPKAVVDFR